MAKYNFEFKQRVVQAYQKDEYEVDDKGQMIIKKLYLDPFMNLCNHEIISYGISQSPSAENIMKALNEAIDITSNCQYRRMFHANQ